MAGPPRISHRHQHRRRRTTRSAIVGIPNGRCFPFPFGIGRRGTVGLLPQLPRQLATPPHPPPRSLERPSPPRPQRGCVRRRGPARPPDTPWESTRPPSPAAPQLLDTGAQAHRQSPLAHSFRRSTKGPSLPRHYPRSPVLRPPPRPADSAPHDAAVGPYRFRPPTGASCCTPPLVHACCRHYPGGTTTRVRFPSWRRPSPYPGGIGFRIRCFRGLLGVRVTAARCRTLFSECFSCFVASTTVPSATGWNDTCRAGITPAERVCLCTAHRDARAPRKGRFATAYPFMPRGDRPDHERWARP